MKLRPYKSCDAEKIAGWIKDEEALRKWSSDRFGEYPVTAQDINFKYIENNGDCEQPDNFYPLTAVVDGEVVGSLILRYIDEKQAVLRVGFVIVDDSIRGKGYGKQMLQLAIKYAFDILGAEKMTLGVFDNNPSAYYCYKAAGFKEIDEEGCSVEMLGEIWKCIEMELK